MHEIIELVRARKMGVEEAFNELVKLGFIRNGNGNRRERIRIILNGVIPRPALTISEAEEELQWLSRGE